jgi:hypothetical protein
VIAGSAELGPGATASVTTNNLRLRDAPGRESDILGVLAYGQKIEITGDSVEAGGEVWWPITATLDGVATDGYVAGEWIAPAESPKDAWLRRATDEVETWPGKLADRFRDAVE